MDPLFAILSSSHGQGGRWNIDQFFATGHTEIDRLFLYMAEIGAVPDGAGRFLDFGCGVGRVSQALALRFASGLGIDISARMIELANQYNPKTCAIEFAQNTAIDLQLVPSASISFVYSHIVLQHISNHMQQRFISEFTRVLEPGGVAAFQIPIENLGPDRPEVQVSWLKRQIPQGVKDALKRLLGMENQADAVSMEMNILPDEEIRTMIRSGGCTVIRLSYSNSTEPDHSGMIEYFDRVEALARIASGRVRSNFLSGFYFMRKENVVSDHDGR